MKQNPTKLWITALALGLLADFLFWEKIPGINFSLFAFGCILAAFYLLLADGLRPRPATLGLILPFGFFAAATVIRAEPLTVFLAVVFTLLSMTLLAVSYLGGKWYLYALGDYFVNLLRLAGSMIASPILLITEIRKEQKESGTQPAKYNIAPILRGALIALPIVALFASLLSSADAVFGQQVEGLIKLFKLENLPEYIFRLIFVGAVAYALAGVFLHAANQSADEKLLGREKSFIPAFLGFTESSIVLGSVVVLFAAFVAVQFQYFFGGETNINVEGYTYAEYARQGFGELVTVAFFSLVMLFALSTITKRETESQRKTYSALGTTLVALLLVMLFSAFKRLELYELAYGFSRLRTYTHVFLVWLALLLVATIVLEIFRKERAFTFALLVASVGFAASLAVLNVDEFIVTHNIQRAWQTEGKNSAELDSRYFIELSDDAIPALVGAYENSALPNPLRERIGAALVCIQNRRTDSRQIPWQSFHLSRFRADAALVSISAELSTYQSKNFDYQNIVTTPSGTDFPCSDSYFMD